MLKAFCNCKSILFYAYASASAITELQHTYVYLIVTLQRCWWCQKIESYLGTRHAKASRRSVLVLFLLSMGKSKTTSKWSHARFYFSCPTLPYPTQRSTHDRQHRPRPTVYNWQYQACTHTQSRTCTLNMLHVQSTCVRCTRVYLEDSFMPCVQFSLMQCVALRCVRLRLHLFDRQSQHPSRNS